MEDATASHYGVHSVMGKIRDMYSLRVPRFWGERKNPGHVLAPCPVILGAKA